MKKIRLGMLQQPANEDDEVVKDAIAGDEEEREVERYGEGGGDNEEEVEDFFANMVGHQVVCCWCHCCQYGRGSGSCST